MVEVFEWQTIFTGIVNNIVTVFIYVLFRDPLFSRALTNIEVWLKPYGLCNLWAIILEVLSKCLFGITFSVLKSSVVLDNSLRTLYIFFFRYFQFFTDFFKRLNKLFAIITGKLLFNARMLRCIVANQFVIFKSKVNSLVYSKSFEFTNAIFDLQVYQHIWVPKLIKH